MLLKCLQFNLQMIAKKTEPSAALRTDARFEYVNELHESIQDNSRTLRIHVGNVLLSTLLLSIDPVELVDFAVDDGTTRRLPR